MSWLNKPYPFIESFKLRLSLSVAIGFLCFLILFIFQPWGLSTIQDGKSFFIFRFGINATIGLLIIYILGPKVFSNFYNIEKWIVGKHIFIHFFLILIIAFLNYLHNSIVGKYFSPQYSFPMFVYFTLSVGALPILLLTYITEKVSSTKNSNEASTINDKNSNPTKHIENTFTITTDTQKDGSLKLLSSTFYYAHSQNNYCHIFYAENGELSNRLIRISLKKLEEQIGNQDDIIRCHRSYLVNKAKIDKISGNARSLVLFLKDVGMEIPVSRSFNKELLIKQ